MGKLKKDLITVEEIIELKLRNPEMSLSEAAKILGCSHSNIVQHLTRAGKRWSELTGITDELERFKSKRADLLAQVQKNILSNISEEEIKKASLKDKTWVFGVLYDKERIERGKTLNDKALYVVLVERSFKKNFLEGGAKIIDASADKPGVLIHSPSASEEKDKESQ